MKKNIIVKKEKALVNGIYKLTLDEQRLFHYTVAKVNPFKDKFGVIYKIPIKDIISFYNLSAGDAYTHFYGALDKLFNRQITFWDESLDLWNTCRFVINKYTDELGVIGLRFSHEMQNMVTSDKDFLSYKLEKTIGITSPNANRIYEVLLYSLQRCPVQRLAKIIPCEELKELMGLSEKYPRFADFKKYVLEVSKVQINKETDIRLDYEIIKTGRSPTHIKFIAQFKKGQEPNSVEIQEELIIEPGKEKFDRVRSKEKLSELKSKLKF
jgi:plasmid replication initiation protein|tara:strand:- start:2094 stop:2897 length:804 start_codon:yes stop_codon:yes gene_type:complete